MISIISIAAGFAFAFRIHLPELGAASAPAMTLDLEPVHVEQSGEAVLEGDGRRADAGVTVTAVLVQPLDATTR